MGVAYGSPDTLPYLCAVYHCAECGRIAERRGRHAGELPSGWSAGVRGDDAEHVCSVCARSTSTAAKRP